MNSITRSLRPLLLLLLLTLSSSLWAAPRASFSLDSTHIGLNSSTNLTFTVTGSNSADPIELPEIPGLVMRSTGSSSSFRSNNGSIERLIAYSYQVVGRKVGSYTIGPYGLSINGEKITTNAVTLKVSAKPPTISNPNIFLRQRTERSTYYIGEPVVLITELLFRRQNIRGVSELQRDSEGFALGEPQQAQQRREVVEGRQFDVASWYQVLSPEKAGTLTIPAVYMTVAIAESSSRDPFSGVFGSSFGRTKQQTFAADALTVEIKELPQKGRPAAFTGMVGEYRLTASVGQEQLQVGEGVTLSWMIKGRGDLDFLVGPEVLLPGGVKAYEPELKREHEPGRLLAGFLQGSQLLVMEQEGEVQIGPLTFNYFDVTTQRYRSLEAGPFTVTVTPGKSAAIATGVNLGAKAVRLLNTDLLPLKNVRPYRQGSLLWLWIVYIVSAVATLVVVLLRRIRARDAEDEGYLRRRRSTKVMRARLAQSRAALSGDCASFCTALAAVVPNFVADKLNIPAASCSGAALLQLLEGKNASDQLLAQLKAFAAQLDGARFSGADLVTPVREELLRECEAIMTALQKELSL